LRETAFEGIGLNPILFSGPAIPHPAFRPLFVFARHAIAGFYLKILYAIIRRKRS
jgi:hypothetical protein